MADTVARILAALAHVLTARTPVALAAHCSRVLAVYGADQPDPAGTFRPLADTGVRVGDVVLAWGHKQWRAATVWEVKGSRVRFVYATPSGLNRYVTGTSRIADAYSTVSIPPVPEQAPEDVPATAAPAPAPATSGRPLVAPAPVLDGGLFGLDALDAGLF